MAPLSGQVPRSFVNHAEWCVLSREQNGTAILGATAAVAIVQTNTG